MTALTRCIYTAKTFGLHQPVLGYLHELHRTICNRVLAVRRAGACGAAGRALSKLWLHWSAAGACANSPPHPARPPRLAGSGELRPAGADTRHRHCDTPARSAGHPEGRALSPKARSWPSTPNLTWPRNARLRDRLY